VREGDDAAFVYVEAGRWTSNSTEDHVKEALIVYCALTPPSGYITITTRTMDGENVFRIKNGHVVSWL